MTITEIIASHLPRPTSVEIEGDTELADLGADELTKQGIAMTIEEITGRDVPDSVSSKWVTVADVARDYGEGVA